MMRRVVEADPLLDVRARYGVPDGVRLEVSPRTVLAFLPACEEAVRRVASGPEDLAPSRHGGRGALYHVADPAGGLLVRPFRKGGLLRLLRGARFRGPWRPLEELVLDRRLAAVGVPVPEAVGCVVLRAPTGWRGFLITREVQGALDLEAWLYGVASPTGLAPSRVLRRAGRAVRALHDAGVAHADLHPKNLLVTPDGAVLVLDLDRARAGDAPLEDDARLGNLARLGRAIEKHRLKGLRTSRRQALRFLEGYAGDRAAARRWLDRVRTRLRLDLGLRTLWWRLLGEARPWDGWARHDPTRVEAR
jgi:3-deoxy-D-manno-octulosonic acid kinase